MNELALVAGDRELSESDSRRCSGEQRLSTPLGVFCGAGLASS